MIFASNTALGNHYLKNGDFETARKYLATAIKRLTKDYTRPSNCEALYLQGLTLKALGLYDEAIDTLYRATWDYAYHSAAYFELAQISCLQGDFEKALQQINESLSTNTKNTRAIALKTGIQRHLGDFAGAAETLYLIPETDPLNFRLANEVYLIEKAARNNPSAEKELAALSKKMRDFDQNYLDLAVGYLDDGMPDEAEEVLLRVETPNPIVHYYLGYIQAKKGNTDEAKKWFTKAQNLSGRLLFSVSYGNNSGFKNCIENKSSDGKACYYLGNILYDKQPEKAVEYWKKSVENNPELAVAFRNLGWAYYRHYKDYDQAISWYEKAMALNPDDAIYYSELDNLYELNNSPVEKRLALFNGKNDVVKNRDDAFVRQITVLTLAGEPEKSVEYLKDKKFSYREGNSRVREVIIDAQISLGIKYFNEKEYEKALQHFLAAQIPDEEAGSARSGNRDIQVNYFIGLAYQALKNNAKAKEYFSMATEAEGRISVMSYFKGLSFQELKKKKEAEEIFNELVETGGKRLNPDSGETKDFFAIFGEREAEQTRQSMAYTLRGLGYKGLGKTKEAKADLEKAVELSVGNLWAQTELNRNVKIIKT